MTQGLVENEYKKRYKMKAAKDQTKFCVLERSCG